MRLLLLKQRQVFMHEHGLADLDGRSMMSDTDRNFG